MRNFAIPLGIVFLFASTAGAQSNPASSTPLPALSTPSSLPEFALNAPLAAASETPSGQPRSPHCESAHPVKPACCWRITAGRAQCLSELQLSALRRLTFMRFYEVPGMTQNQNGFNLGGVYYYHAGFVGADGELLATFGSALGYGSRFSFAGGGPRFRRSGPRRVEL